MDLESINEKILSMKRIAEDLGQAAEGFPALARNTARLSASIRMLEINVTDLVDLEGRRREFEGV